MTEVKNLMTFYMIYGMKETCRLLRQGGRMRQAKPCMIWSQFKQNVMTKLNLVLFSYWTYPYPSLSWCAGFQKGPELCGFARGCLIISMTFMNFPKPPVKFHDFSRPGKRKWNSMTFPGFPWLDTPCLILPWFCSPKRTLHNSLITRVVKEYSSTR